MSDGGSRNASSMMRGARWQVLLILAVLLAVAGAFMLIDPGRAELVAGLAVGALFLLEGISYVVGRMGSQPPGRGGEVDALRSGIGLLTATLLFGLSFLNAITLVGVRLIIVVGGLSFGVLGLWLVVLTARSGIRWGFGIVHAIVVAYAILLLVTQVANNGAFDAVMTVVAYGAIVSAIILVVVALLRARSARTNRAGDAA